VIRYVLAGVLLLGGTGVYFASQSTDALLFAANLPDRFMSEAPPATEYAYGSAPRSRLSVYTRGRGESPRPVVIFWHGGRWSYGDMEQYQFVARTLVGLGAVAVLPNYRLYPAVRLDGAMRDVAAAVAFVQSHATEWGGDPDRVIVMGHSAGAQLAALALLDSHWVADAGGRPVQALVGLAGPYDFLPLTDDDLKDYFGPPARYPQSQPINFVTPPGRPAFLVHGLKDTTVWPRNTEHLAAALETTGGRVETHYLAGEDHGAVLSRFVALRRGTDPVVAALGRFIRSVPGGAVGGGLAGPSNSGAAAAAGGIARTADSKVSAYK
jgi:acetyl esterase/lipase